MVKYGPGDFLRRHLTLASVEYNKKNIKGYLLKKNENRRLGFIRSPPPPLPPPTTAPPPPPPPTPRPCPTT